MDTDPTAEYMRITGRWWEMDAVPEVAHAVGMVAVQVDCPIRDAVTLLRAHAAASGQDPVDVALDVVRRELAFTR